MKEYKNVCERAEDGSGVAYELNRCAQDGWELRFIYVEATYNYVHIILERDRPVAGLMLGET